MSGLFVCFGDRDPVALAGHAARFGTGEATTVSDSGLYLCAVDNPSRAPHAESPSTIAFVYGVLYRRRGPGDKGDGAYVLARYEAEGPRALEELNGSFIAVVVDRRNRRLSVANDRAGSVLSYYRVQSDHAFILSTRCAPMFGLDGFSPAVDTPTLVSHLMFGRAKLTQAPFFVGVAPLRPGSRVDAVIGAAPTIARYSRFQDRSTPCSLEDAAIRASDTIGAIVREQILEHERVAFSLSGGIDSRVMLATIPDELLGRIVAVSFGMAGNNESAIAKRLADARGLHIVDVTLAPRDFIADAEQTVEVNEGQDMFLQGFVFRFLRNLRQAHGVDAIMDGMEVGLSLGGDLLRPSFREVPSAAFAGWLFDHYCLHERAPEEVFRVDAVAMVKPLVEHIAAETAALPSVYDKMDWFIIEHYAREPMRQRHRLTREAIEGIPIAVDTRFIDLVETTPAALREGRKVELEILRRLAPDSLSIPYHGTMVPLDASPEEWAAGRARIAGRERDAQEAWRASRTHVPYNHYYTNFAEWLRCDRDIVAFTNDLLVSESCRIGKELVHREWLLRTVREHQTGEADHRSTIQYLLTVELFLRHFGL